MGTAAEAPIQLRGLTGCLGGREVGKGTGTDTTAENAGTLAEIQREMKTRDSERKFCNVKFHA